ncbi:hypothetical protein D3C85_552980 [compost metagenome]
MRAVGRGPLIANTDTQGAGFAQAPHQLQVDCRPAAGRLAIHRNDFLPHLQAGSGRQTADLHRTDDRTHLLAAEHRHRPEKHQSQQEVGQRPRRHYGNTLAHALAIERLIELPERHLAFALIEHLDVAAQGNRGDDELGALAIMPAQQRRAEAHGETQHLDPTAARHPEVTEFVKGHQHPQGNQGTDNHIERTHLASPRLGVCSQRRASRAGILRAPVNHGYSAIARQAHALDDLPPGLPPHFRPQRPTRRSAQTQ